MYDASISNIVLCVGLMCVRTVVACYSIVFLELVVSDRSFWRIPQSLAADA